jgi:hypothetical protein
MDPLATLHRAEAALNAGDLDTTQEALGQYRAWRRAGGFEPLGGDAQARRLEQRLRQRQQAQSDDPAPVANAVDSVIAGLLTATPFNAAMRAAIFRCTAARPDLLGYHLARHREARALDQAAQAEALGIDVDGLARLSLCRTPRRKHYARDLEGICRRTGASRDVLVEMLRGE